MEEVEHEMTGDAAPADELTPSDPREAPEVPEAPEQTEPPQPPQAREAQPLEDVMFRVMHLDSVLYDLTDPSPMVHLLEAEAPFRYLVIPVALADAIAIQHAHSSIEGRRPGTHELMNAVLTRLGTEVIAARIVRYENGVFFAELDLMTPKGRQVFDCRTSDALTMALRQNSPAPILCSEEVLQHYYA
ncbi:MAG: bifunctional nuclease family protein [Acidimicrobiales bacterium]